MIFRRYGERLHSVRPNFDARAMTEIGFRRDHETELPVDTFAAEYERVTEHALAAEADGDVQNDVEEAVLASLAQQLDAIERGAAADELLVIENEQGRDPAKTVGRQNTVVAGYENRLHFRYTVEPPLRVGVYRRTGSR
jgi:hypothetical protein